MDGVNLPWPKHFMAKGTPPAFQPDALYRRLDAHQLRGGGYERDWQRWGLIREIDVAPTICHLMDLRLPRQNQGVVPYNLLRKE